MKLSGPTGMGGERNAPIAVQIRRESHEGERLFYGQILCAIYDLPYGLDQLEPVIREK